MSRWHLRKSPSEVNLWRIPLGLSLGSGLLFATTMAVDVLDARHVIALPWWVTMGGIDDARAILSAMLSAVSTVLALIFSVTLLVLSMVATLFGPRLLYRFLRDRVTQVTIGLFMATFVYLCLVFLVTHEDAHSRFVPQVSLLTSWFLVLGSFGFLVFYSHRVATSIQNPDLVARIVHDFVPALTAARETRRLAHPSASSAQGVVEGADDRADDDGGEVHSLVSGYLQEIGHRALVHAAKARGARVQVLRRPGQFVFRGEVVARVTPAEQADSLGRKILEEIVLGRHRSPTQDFEFGIAQVVEIGIRALSPAVNDTFTGVGCVDQLGDALLLAAEAGDFDGRWHDEDGVLRLRVRPVRLERLVRMAFDQVRQAATDNPAVLVRILDTIARIAPRLSSEPVRGSLRDEVDACREHVEAGTLARIDRLDLESAWQRARAAVER